MYQVIIGLENADRFFVLLDLLAKRLKKYPSLDHRPPVAFRPQGPFLSCETVDLFLVDSEDVHCVVF